HHRYLSIPRVITPSFWASLIPKPLRRNAPVAAPSAAPKGRQPNPAAPFIVLSLLVGSQAIQILWLKRERNHYMRRAEAKMDVLREVIEKVQNGEDVDVEKELGTGNAQAEQEWKEVLKDIENEEVLFRSKKRRRALRAAEAEKEKQDPELAAQGKGTTEAPTLEEDGPVKVETYNGARFY
ncbi:uncharacterized protein EI97DRAFT_353780, partial [Westerdykella ornata]